MMARVVIRKPEIPCFVLNSQVRVADWEQVCGTHQGQRQTSTPRSKAGHRTVLINRAINAFFSCKADAIHTGQSGLVQARLSLTQKTLASEPCLALRCSSVVQAVIEPRIRALKLAQLFTQQSLCLRCLSGQLAEGSEKFNQV